MEYIFCSSKSMLCGRNICLLVEKGCGICVIWIFSIIIKDGAFSCYDNFFKVVLPPCYIKLCCLWHPVISCRLYSFLRMKNVKDLVRNFSTQTFASSHPLLCMIFNEFKWKRLIASQRRCWAKKEEHLKICCF